MRQLSTELLREKKPPCKPVSFQYEPIRFACGDAHRTTPKQGNAIFRDNSHCPLQRSRLRCVQPLTIGAEAALCCKLRATSILDQHLLLEPTSKNLVLVQRRDRARTIEHPQQLITFRHKTQRDDVFVCKRQIVKQRLFL